jgi:dUTP pyrophosphatase
MSKFKIGDIVRLKDNLTEGNTGISQEDLKILFNKNLKIISIDYEDDDNPEITLNTSEHRVEYDYYFNKDGIYKVATKIRGFEIVSDNHRKSQEEITLPTRGTKKSAGYDFYSPIDIQIQPNQKVCIWSDVKAYMQEGEVLLLFVRSSIGIKRGLRLSNSTGVIDSDYFSNEDNDGNIGIALHNYTDKIVTIEKGERVCQGVFAPFLVADNGNTDTERNGGIGSTN